MNKRNTQYAIRNTKPSEVNEVINTCAQLIVEKCVDGLEAVVLIGSFSRGEGIVHQANGVLKFLSDIEYLAVVKKNTFKRSNVQIDGIEEEIQENMGREGIDVKVSLGFTTRKHLKRFKPCIFIVETKKFGKVVWGVDAILESIPDYSYDDIEPLDGFVLLNNRIVEQLIVWQKVSSGQSVRYYDIVKGYIQLVNVYLVINRAYKSLYPEKQEEFLRTIAAIGKRYDERTRGRIDEATKRRGDERKEMLEAINKAFDNLKTNPARELNKEEALMEWRKLKYYFKEIWLYEARNLLKNDDLNLEEAVAKFISIPDFKTRLKGWTKLFLGKGCSILDIRCSMGDLFRTSPQFLIYQRAARAYFNDTADNGERLAIIKAWETFVK